MKTAFVTSSILWVFIIFGFGGYDLDLPTLLTSAQETGSKIMTAILETIGRIFA